MRDEVRVQLHDVTRKVQSARPCIAAQVRELRVAALELRDLKKIIIIIIII